MEGNLLPYLAARVSVDTEKDCEMATLVSPAIAITVAHALPGELLNGDGQHVARLNFPQMRDLKDVQVTVEGFDQDVDFAVLKLEKPLSLPSSAPVFSAEPAAEGALWETLVVVPSSSEGIRVRGRIKGIEIVGKRSLLKLSVFGAPLIHPRFGGAPVIVDGKVIGIFWGKLEAEPSKSSKIRQSSKERHPEQWYALPMSAIIESKSSDAFRKLLDPKHDSQPDLFTSTPATDNPTHPKANGGYPVNEIVARLKDANKDVRAEAVHALTAQVSSDPEVRAAVIERLNDESGIVRAATVSALSGIVKQDAEVSDAVAKLLDDKNSSVRTVVVRTFADMAHDQNIRAALTARLKDESRSVRAAAVKALNANGADTRAAMSSETAITPDAPKSAEAVVAPDASAEVEAAVTPDSPPVSDESQARQDIPQVPSEPPPLERSAFFQRLSPSSRRALSFAAGTDQPVCIEFLVLGLFENRDGPTRRLFLDKNIDAAELTKMIGRGEDSPSPFSINNAPVKLRELPTLTTETEHALRTARDIAGQRGATQIQSRHLLYGALSNHDNSLVRMLAEGGVRQEDVRLAEMESNEAPAPKAIAFVSADTSTGEDLLGFDGDVNALSAIIAAKAIEPPLSIGLFGDWGSGKSFFMGKMDKRIRDLTEIERASKGNSAYCSNIVQIWFNAWSYVETDLWASLVTDIFEELARAIDRDGELAGSASPATAKARLLAAMASARDIVAEEERRRDAARAELEAVEEHVANLKATDEELQKKLGSGALLKDAYRVVAKESKVKAQLDEAAKRLNIPEAARAAGDLRASLLEIKGLWSALGYALKGWKSTEAWLMGAGALLAVVFFLWVIPWLLGFNPSSTITGISGVLISAGAWLTPFIKKAKTGLEIIGGIKEQQQQRINDERNRIEAESRKQQDGVRQKLSEAELRRDNAVAEVGRLEQALREMRADKQLLNFIRERSLSTDYTSRLGTVARARKDFKQLSELMDRVRTEKPDRAGGSNGADVGLMLPRIDRIVLYIDDLDRCPEDKVVNVLEAVHLLLAFRLFVVVVAVDSRWLLHSLRQHSAAFQVSNEGGAGISDEELAHWDSTPLNYLEKIFQIPFYLRPMRGRGFGRLVDAVVGPVASDREDRSHIVEKHAEVEKPVEKARTEEPVQKAGAAREAFRETGIQQVTARYAKAEAGDIARAGAIAGAIASARAGDSPRPIGTASPTNGGVVKPAAPTPGSDGLSPVTPITPEETNPAALQLVEWERDFMKKLHPLINSPRSAKRFINIYRLMRVSITDQAELTAFVGDRNEGQHRAALLLLAILTGYPEQATDILRDLLEKERPETWWQYVDGLEKSWNDPSKSSSGSGYLSTQRRRDLMDKLRLLRGEIPETESCDAFVKWASKVAKYSFESGRVLMLLNDDIEAD